jgi:hypothetical protein
LSLLTTSIGRPLASPNPLEHWNGTKWKVVTLPSVVAMSSLYDVLSPHDLNAYAGDAQESGPGSGRARMPNGQEDLSDTVSP